MKEATGITRKIDGVGRIVIPKELRDMLEFDEDTMIEMVVDKEQKQLILNKYQRGCIFCNSLKDTTNFEGKTICKDCLAKLKKE